MTGGNSKRKRGGSDHCMHGLNLEDASYSTIRRCFRARSHPTDCGNYVMSHDGCNQPPTLHTQSHNNHNNIDALHGKRTGSQTARESKYPRAGVNSNRFIALSVDEEDEPQQNKHGCGDGEHSTEENKSDTSASA